jgi:hypothetical protein
MLSGDGEVASKVRLTCLAIEVQEERVAAKIATITRFLRYSTVL